VLYFRKAKITKLRPIVNMHAQKAHLLLIWWTFSDHLSIDEAKGKCIPAENRDKKTP